MAFEENGTVRDARGFASMHDVTSSLSANWTFISPRTSSSAGDAAP